MPNQQTTGVVVEIVERRVPAPPDVRQQRTDVVDRLDNLGQIDAGTGVVANDVVVGFDVRVNGALVPVPALAYEVVAGERGPQVTVTFAVDTVSVAARPSVATPEGRVSRAWGGGRQDPRESVPGWTPEVARG